MTLVVRAGSLVELARAQGRATAASRADRLREDRALVMGRTGTAWDDLARRTLLVETARRGFEALDDESRDVFDAYADGVHEVLDEGTDESWPPWLAAGVFALHHVLFGTFGHHLWRRHVRRTLGQWAVDALAQEVPAMSGSNAWVVGGGRTRSGAPLLGADPHRLLSWPGVYQQVRLVADDVDVVGLTFPGVPGVQHFGHTGSVAWAVTNAMADTQDAIEVALRLGPDGVEANRGDGWRGCRDVEGALRTPWGPLVVGSPPDRSGVVADGVVMRWTVHEIGDLGLAAIVPLLRARSARDVDAALDHWVEPVNDVLVADRDGVVLHRLAGRVPRRTAERATADGRDGIVDWDGWIQHPAERIAADGYAVSANQRRPGRDHLAREFAPPHRAERLDQLLGGRRDLGVDDADTIHGDTTLPTAAAWQRRLAGLSPTSLSPTSGPAGERRELLLGWDTCMDADSAAAGAFADLRSTLVRRLAAHRVLAPLRQDPELDPVWAPWVQPEPRIALALDRWIAGPASVVPPGIDLDDELAAALVESAARPAQEWGRRHGVDLPGRGWVPLSGDDGCVLSTASVPGVTDECWRGPVARVVWDLADRTASRWIVPDDVEAWAAGDTRGVEEP